MGLVMHPPKGAEWLAALREAAPGVEIVEVEEQAVPEALRTADAFYGQIRPEWLTAPRLRWIQTPKAGSVRGRFSKLVVRSVLDNRFQPKAFLIPRHGTPGASALGGNGPTQRRTAYCVEPAR